MVARLEFLANGERGGGAGEHVGYYRWNKHAQPRNWIRSTRHQANGTKPFARLPGLGEEKLRCFFLLRVMMQTAVCCRIPQDRYQVWWPSSNSEGQR